MQRREILKVAFGAASLAAVDGGQSEVRAAEQAPSSASADTLYVHAGRGADANPGNKDQPLRTLAEAVRRVNQSAGDSPVTIVVAEGIYALGETVVIKPERRTFTRTARLTVRAEVLPDDPEWHTGRMPTLIHTMPLPSTWNGRPDPLGGAADGFLVETSAVPVHRRRSHEPAARGHHRPWHRHRRASLRVPRDEDVSRLLDRRQHRACDATVRVRRRLWERRLDGGHRVGLRLPQERHPELQLRVDGPGGRVGGRGRGWRPRGWCTGCGRPDSPGQLPGDRQLLRGESAAGWVRNRRPAGIRGYRSGLPAAHRHDRDGAGRGNHTSSTPRRAPWSNCTAASSVSPRTSKAACSCRAPVMPSGRC